MSRGPRLSIESVETRVMDYLVGFVKDNNAPTDLAIPKTDDIMRHLLLNGQRVPRSSVYRIWSYREDMIDGLVRHLLNDDLYNTEALREKHRVISGSINYGTQENGQDMATQRKSVLSAMGKAAIETTDYALVRSVEAAARLRVASDQPEFLDLLHNTQSQYIGTLVTGYELVHAKLGDRLKEDIAYDDYVKTVATTAQSIALNPFGLSERAQAVQFDQFQYIADQFTQPVA